MTGARQGVGFLICAVPEGLQAPPEGGARGSAWVIFFPRHHVLGSRSYAFLHGFPVFPAIADSPSIGSESSDQVSLEADAQ